MVKSGFELTTFDDFLQYNRASLTTRLRRLSIIIVINQKNVTVRVYHAVRHPKIATEMDNSADPDQSVSWSSLIWVCRVWSDLSHNIDILR